MNEHPAVAAGALTGLAALIVWLVDVAGYEMPPAVAATVAGVIVAAGLALRRYGLKGLAGILWRGNK
jgi:hypothetical protein